MERHNAENEAPTPDTRALRLPYSKQFFFFSFLDHFFVCDFGSGRPSSTWLGCLLAPFVPQMEAFYFSALSAGTTGAAGVAVGSAEVGAGAAGSSACAMGAGVAAGAADLSSPKLGSSNIGPLVALMPAAGAGASVALASVSFGASVAVG